jgi:RHS repeat-associated protein
MTETAFADTEFPLTTKHHYDITGNRDRTTFSDGSIEIYNYGDPYGRLAFLVDSLNIRYGFAYGVRDYLATKTVSDASGNVLQVHQFSIDERGRLVTADINGLKSLTLYDRDDRVTASVNHLGDTSTTAYDGVGRISVVSDPLGNRRRLTYDPAGNIASSYTDSLVADGSYFSFGDTITYDARSRPVRLTDSHSNSVAFVYDDRNMKTAVINPLGQQSTYHYDLNGQLVRSCVMREGHESVIHRWYRDRLGRLLVYEDAAGNRTLYDYDGRGSPVRTEYPDHSVVTRAYDQFARIATETDCNGSTSSFSYNSLGQLVQIDFQASGPALATSSIVYGYDSFGRCTQISSGTHDIRRVYDNFNRLTSETQDALTSSTVIDEATRSTEFHYPDGRVDRYSRDELGRVTEIRFAAKGSANCVVGDFPDGTELARYEYEGLFLRRRRLANGAVTEYDYDGCGRLLGFTVKDPTGNAVDGERWLRDGAGKKRLVLRTEFANATSCFRYDDMRRLAESHAGRAVAIPADLVTQPAIDAFVAGVYNSAATERELYSLRDDDTRVAWEQNGVQFSASYDNRLQPATSTASTGASIQYVFDHTGNRIEDDRFRYSYDVLDNLVQVVRKSDNAVVLENVYDGLGRVIERRENGAARLFFYNEGRCLQETSVTMPTVQNTSGAASDEIVVQSRGGVNYFCHQDSLQSLTCLTDRSGAPLQYCSFSPFGSVSVLDAGRSPITRSDALVDLTFSGRPYVASIDKYHLGKRYYDSSVGLFLQPDPAGNAESGNQHLYCLHDPVNRRDASGLRSDTWEPPMPATPLTDDEIANRRQFLKEISFGIGNAITAGGLKKMVDRKSTGPLSSDLGANLWIGVSSFSNMASLGFQEAIWESKAETQGDLVDIHFSLFEETAAPGAEIGYGLLASVAGPLRGLKNNVASLLPVAELETLLDSHASSASTWEAVFNGLSKVASLAALGAGARQNTMRSTGGPERTAIEINVAKKPNGGMFDYHASAYIQRFRLLYERDGRGNTHSVQDRPNQWRKEIYPPKGTDIYVTTNELDTLVKYVKKNSGRGGWRRQGLSKSIFFDNCSMESARMLNSIGIDTISLHPSLLKFSVENQSIFTTVKSFLPNPLIQQTERKK